MSSDLRTYRSLVFDCDGVLLDSNRIKTDAFYQATLPFGEVAARSMVEYHLRNGGVSRYEKFTYFLDEIATATPVRSMDELLGAYSAYVRRGLLECPVAEGLKELREHCAENRWLVVSGSDQRELRDVLRARGVAAWFDGGIFGSPDNKDEILARELARGNIIGPALFLGDSKYDHRAATAAGLDFLFLTKWTEVQSWQTWVVEEGIRFDKGIGDLIVA